MDSSWKNINPAIHPKIYKTLVKQLKFVAMTPVQAATIPLFLQNKDVATEAITGSGKTLAFLVPVLHNLLKKKHCVTKNDISTLILVPTAELASQIQEVLSHFKANIPDLQVMSFVRMKDVDADIQNFLEHGCHILIATPGRLDGILSRRQKISEDNFMLFRRAIRSLDVLIMDEADRLLDLGFETSINHILAHLPKLRRTGLFSATLNDGVENLVKAGLRNPVRITVKEKLAETQADSRTPCGLTNSYMICESDEKLNQLVYFLREPDHSHAKVMVFFSTCAAVDYFARLLTQLLKKSTVLCIHGKMKQRRLKIFKKFQQMDGGVLLCTDLMARGVDIPEVNWVIQFDPPSSASAFVHRCGRTARIGNTGNALIYLRPVEDAYVKFLAINQKAPMSEFQKPLITLDVLPEVRKMAIKDKIIYEKGMRAYVSFVQSYLKHECYLIFRAKDLDYGRLATGFGLLRLPVMPELKGKTVKNFLPAEIDISTLTYKNKNTAKLREMQKLLKTPYTPTPDSWSKKKAQAEKKKANREKRQLQKQKKKDMIQKRKLEKALTDKDLAELDEDFRMVKKLRKGKISEHDFDDRFNLDNQCPPRS